MDSYGPTSFLKDKVAIVTGAAQGNGFAIAEREVEPKEEGGSPRHLHDIVLGVVRGGRLVRVDDPEVDALESGDRLLYIRSADAER